MEETTAHRKRLIMKLLKEEGGGRRRSKVGAYRTATYSKAIAMQAITASGFETTPSCSICRGSCSNPREGVAERDIDR